MAINKTVPNTEWQIYEIVLYFDYPDGTEPLIRRIYRYRETCETLTLASIITQQLRRAGKAIAIFTTPILTDGDDIDDIFPVVGVRQRGKGQL